MTWERVLGRVSFINCDPVFHSLDDRWGILAAPPSWLTGHLLRKDCITAPIPTADYASHQDELVLISDIGIVGREEVGSVLLFGNRPLESMRDIALPSDSSTSRKLLTWILNERGLDPKLVEMGPDIDSMLDNCDGALIIGDRAISAAYSDPSIVQMDLSREWTDITGYPMVFGVFAARKDSHMGYVNEAREAMLEQYYRFLEDEQVKMSVIDNASRNAGISVDRVSAYFDHEVTNLMDEEALRGLKLFLGKVCGVESPPSWIGPSI